MKNPLAEKHLDQVLAGTGITYRYEPAIPLERFDPASLQNQARPTALLQETIDEYALCMMDGVEFPALVSYPRSELFVLIDGNQRRAGADLAELTHFDSYVVETGNQLIIDLLTKTFNQAVNGVRLGHDESIQGALAYQQKYGLAVEQVAQSFRLKADDLRTAARGEQARARWSALGLDPRKFAPSTLERLNSIRSDTVLGRAALLVLDTRMTGSMVSSMVKQINQARSEAAALAVVDKWSVRPDVSARRPYLPTSVEPDGRNGTVIERDYAYQGSWRVRTDDAPNRIVSRRAKLFSLLGQLRRLVEEAPTQELLELVTDEDRATLHREWSWLAARFARMEARRAPTRPTSED